MNKTDIRKTKLVENKIGVEMSVEKDLGRIRSVTLVPFLVDNPGREFVDVGVEGMDGSKQVVRLPREAFGMKFENWTDFLDYVKICLEFIIQLAGEDPQNYIAKTSMDRILAQARGIYTGNPISNLKKNKDENSETNKGESSGSAISLE